MADDIVTRLRDTGFCGVAAQQEAADEIERLRAEVARRPAVTDSIVTRLREMATDMARHSTHYDGCDQSHLECAVLHACDEIERLRAAGDALVNYLGHVHDVLAIVRAAWQEARRG